MTVWVFAWFWQSIALTATIGVLLKVKRINASTRYLVWWGVLCAVLWLGYTSSPYRGIDPIAVSVRGADSDGADFAQEPYLHITEASPLLISMFLGVWVAIALVKLIRLVPSLHAVYALRDRCHAFPYRIEPRLPLWLEARDRGRRAELMLCDAIPGATVLGFQRPSIALPPGLVEALSVEELDQIILHEHAHVQRYDDWASLAQELVQAALWIHPAVALIGRSLNRERELACDERVVATTGLPKAYARCLTRAAEVRNRIRVEPLLVPALFARPHHLVRRVNRLLAIKGKTRCSVSPLIASAAACVIAGLSIQLSAVRLVGERNEIVLPSLARAVTLPDEPDVPPANHATSPGREAFAEPRRVLPAAGRRARTTRTATSSRPIADDQKDASVLAPSAQMASVDQPDSPGAPVDVLSARSFDAVYRAGNASSDAPSVWRSAATPGVEIANAARKTGVGIASLFGRAGVSLARSF
jgi:beta-lactamase regulating signal transducer with metallopeptidase domain